MKLPSLPIQLLIILFGVLVFGKMLPVMVIRASYTVSVLFKEFLVALLPVIVGSFVLTGMLAFRKNAPVVLGTIMVLTFISNALVAFLSYGLINTFFNGSTHVSLLEKKLVENSVQPLVSWELPFMVRTELVLLFSILVGLVLCYRPVASIERVIFKVKNMVDWVLTSVIIPVLPFYVLGFLLKIRYEGVLVSLMEYYGSTIISIVAMQAVCLSVLYLVAMRAHFSRWYQAISNALPSYLTAFSTMSSTVTVPVSVACAKKNDVDPALADVAMPILANVHMMGDSIGIPSLALITKLLFTGTLPTFIDFAIFIGYFCVTMFASSGIPGGAILVMIPILISHFAFTTDMITIITTLFLMLDSFGTAANVMGDGALVLIIQRILRRMKIVS